MLGVSQQALQIALVGGWHKAISSVELEQYVSNYLFMLSIQKEDK